MATNMRTDYLSCLANLENGRSPSEQFQRILGMCKNQEEGLPVRLPEWFATAEKECFGDVEEMLFALPQVIAEWYNKNGFSFQILTPDAVLARNGRQVLERISKEQSCPAEFIYVKANGDFECKGLAEKVLLLCPGRYQSMQLVGVSKKLTPNTPVLLLDPDTMENFGVSIRENDVKQLEFLFARWEIETQVATKRLRFQELLDHCRAIIGGEKLER